MANDIKNNMYFNDLQIFDCTHKVNIMGMYHRVGIEKIARFQTRIDKRLHVFETMSSKNVKRLANRRNTLN